MKASAIPAKFPVAFASSAGAGFVRSIPTTPPGQVGAAALTTGFPPANFTPEGAGGVPPFGADINGILLQISQWTQWQNAGGAVPYDSTFQSAIGGYPQGSIVESVTNPGQFWISTTDDNTTNPDSAGAGWNPWPNVIPAGGCQLQYASVSALLLAAVNGGQLWINGTNYTVPASLTLSNGGLANSTTYYIYAYMNSGTMTLEASTTGYTLAANGMPQKTGDASRTLVGICVTNSSGQFQAAPLVLSWFNRRNIAATASPGALTWTGATAEIPSFPRISFLTWGNESVASQCTGLRFNSSSGSLGSDLLSIAIDGTEVGSVGGGYVSGEASQSGNFSTSYAGNLSESLHYMTVFGATTGGTTGTLSEVFASVVVRG